MEKENIEQVENKEAQETENNENQNNNTEEQMDNNQENQKQEQTKTEEDNNNQNKEEDEEEVKDEKVEEEIKQAEEVAQYIDKIDNRADMELFLSLIENWIEPSKAYQRIENLSNKQQEQVDDNVEEEVKPQSVDEGLEQLLNKYL